VLQWPESGDSLEAQITATGGQRPPDWQGIEISSRGIQTFTVPTPVSNPADWPYSAIVRLNVTWPSGGTGTCSGVIVDPRHALTAGHCVFDYNDPGRDYEPCPGPSDSCWAAAIEVIPAYDNGNAPYGKTHMIQPMSWTSWTGGTLETKDYAHDMAVVYFDRPVGALTGWYGYGAAADNFYLTQEFSNSGYPGADLSDGQTMWVRDGTFDMIEIYQAGHRDLSYSGQSGSGYAYEYVDEYWRIYAIASHYHQETDQETITYCPRITTGKLADITYWIQGHTPQQPDLVPLDVRVTPTSIEAGRQISSTSFLIHNYSSKEWTGTLTIDVYLSTDSNISAADELINTDSYQGTIGSKNWIRRHIPEPLTIPKGKKGIYYIGVIINAADSDTSNNATAGWDAAQITVSKVKHRVYLPVLTNDYR